MVSINYSSREVNCKIVYYGPGLSGKTTNLQYVHAKVPKKTRGDLISLATDADRTLYFDFLPINIGAVNGFATKFQLYTVPGQVFYNATRKLVLRGVDGLVFVADSQRSKREENIESLNNLKENLLEYGYDINSLPIVLQYNKRDLAEVMSIAEMQKDLNWNNLHYFEASAVKGLGVFDTLKLITKLVLNKARKADAPEVVAAGEPADFAPTQVEIAPAVRKEPALDVVSAPRIAATAATTTTVAPTPLSLEPSPRRLEVSAPPEMDDWSLAAKTQESPPVTSRSGRMTLSEIESKLQQIPDDDAKGLKASLNTGLRASNDEQARSQFADAFEVPKVVGMQKSLKVKKKKKRFFLFSWFSKDND